MPRAARVPVMVLGGLFALALLVVGGAYLLNGADVPNGVRVAGVDVGGVSEARARERLQQSLGDRTEGPLRLQAGEQVLELDPQEAGLRLDLDATLAEATRGSFVDRVRGVFGSDVDITPVTTVDAGALRTALTDLAEDYDRPLREGAITFDGITPQAVLPQSGRTVRLDEAVDAVTTGWLEPEPVGLPVDETAPALSADAVRRAVSTVAAPAVAGSLTLTAAGDGITLSPSDTASALTFAAKDGTLVPQVDGTALLARLGDRLDAVQDEPADATFEIEDGTPVLVPARAGRTATPGALSTAVLAAIASPSRTAALQLQAELPRVGTTAARQLGIKEKIGTFTTYHPSGAPRVTNIHRIADLVDGHVVLPGETYSLNGDVGERTRAKGFVAAPQIQDGEFVDGVGGGISQFTTTMYNATFFAGLEDVEHTPHSYYISRYPEGREATITFPAPDLKWKNDSPTGVLITTSYTGGSITVTLYGTKRYDEVLSQSSGRTRITSPESVTRSGPTCSPASGRSGFSVTITRVMKIDGAEVKRTRASHRYLAEPRVTCASTP